MAPRQDPRCVAGGWTIQVERSRQINDVEREITPLAANPRLTGDRTATKQHTPKAIGRMNRNLEPPDGRQQLDFLLGNQRQSTQRNILDDIENRPNPKRGHRQASVVSSLDQVSGPANDHERDIPREHEDPMTGRAAPGSLPEEK